ncbi:MAG: diguanylate cyclase [Defluviitaleaceae bacterium]|nr:diguanylate cyclase [Defluviitaleaceae bacterium]
MNKTPEKLFAYLRDVIYAPSKAVLDVNSLGEEYIKLGKGIQYLAKCLFECNDFAQSIARGDLSVNPPSPQNELAAPLKSLHLSLRHLTWQSQQVAKGDYRQRVDFMGDFAGAFNVMVSQLAERQEKLEAEIELNKKRATALSESNQLLMNITQHIPQQIFVLDIDTMEILLMNDMAKMELGKNPRFLERLLPFLVHKESTDDIDHHTEVQMNQNGKDMYLAIDFYLIDWNRRNAIAMLIQDVSAEKTQIQELEYRAYRDSMSGLFNRFYGMNALSEWLVAKKPFYLAYMDLDNLKHINDVFGHSEGDMYIKNVAGKMLTGFPDETVVCRIGGDEFMLLIPTMNYDDLITMLKAVQETIRTHEYLDDKEYEYFASFGVVSVKEENTLGMDELLALADERMYEQKRERKRSRHQQQQQYQRATTHLKHQSMVLRATRESSRSNRETNRNTGNNNIHNARVSSGYR